MTSENLSPQEFESLNPETDRVLSRDDEESYVLDVSVISGATNESRAYTYTENTGTYKVSSEDSPRVVEALDAVFSRINSECAVLGGLSRTPGDSYEIVVETVEESVNTAAHIRGASSAEYQVMADSELAVQLDEALSSLNDTVSE